MSSTSIRENQNPVHREATTNNPYRHGLKMIVDRLIWDCRPISWKSRKVIKSWKDRYPNQKCVILCNGPSLLVVDFPGLAKSGVFTFGLNKINLLFDKEDFRPSCIVAVNPLVIEQNKEFYNETNLPLFLSQAGIPFIKHRSSIAFLHNCPRIKFARNCAMSLAHGFTVTYVAMQLAFHMGFREVALVGCDHNFATQGTANMAVKSEAEDKSHFDPRYFSGGVLWQLPDLKGSEFFYDLAGRTFDACGGRIVNCTDGGKLELFPRMTLEKFING